MRRRISERRDPFANTPAHVRYAFGGALIGLLALGFVLSGGS